MRGLNASIEPFVTWQGSLRNWVVVNAILESNCYDKVLNHYDKHQPHFGDAGLIETDRVCNHVPHVRNTVRRSFEKHARTIVQFLPDVH